MQEGAHELEAVLGARAVHEPHAARDRGESSAPRLVGDAQLVEEAELDVSYTLQHALETLTWASLLETSSGTLADAASYPGAVADAASARLPSSGPKRSAILFARALLNLHLLRHLRQYLLYQVCRMHVQYYLHRPPSV